MLRRKFIQLMTVIGAAGGLATLEAVDAGEARTISYRVKGFTCITCAVGLETLLRQQKGVVWAKASYPDATAIIRFKPSLVSESRLKQFIAEMGFVAESEQRI
jgi:copper chaperone CopZ